MRLFAFVLVVLTTASLAWAQDPAGAEAAAQAYADAVAAGDWEAAAALTDPLDLARFSEFVGVFSEVAGDELGDTDALTDADTPEAAFAAFMGLLTTMEPMMGDMLTSVQNEILGSVTEGDTLVHVVSRTSFDLFGSEVRGLEVTTTRWDGTRWVVKLNEQMEGMITAMETAFADPSVLEPYEPAAEFLEGAPLPRDPKKRQ